MRARPGVAAIVVLGFGWALVMHSMGWAQLAHFAQVRALHAGQAEIDPWHWETKDKAYVDGRFYSVKPPGVAALSLPAYAALDAAGARSLAADAAANARASAHPRWSSNAAPPYPDHGFSPARARATGLRVETNAPIVWVLTLLVATLPAVGLLLAVRWVSERLEPGFGTAAAITLGLGTVIATFAAEYFSHVIATGAAFGAFALLFRERQGPAPRTALVGAAGLLAGLAVTFEYPLGLVGVVLFAYALARGAQRLPRALAYGAGAFLGAVPALAFNLWAFGSPFEFAYANAVESQGISGAAIVGLNDDGLFGITAPRAGAAFDLLFASRGVVTLTPVLLMGIAGTVLMRRRGWRAEANVVGAVALAYFVYNAGYWLTFGGGTPGPRFLIPAMPFLALGLAFAYRRLPALTLGLAIPSAIAMLLGSLTFPLIGDNGIALWVQRLYDGSLEHTVLTALGVSDAWLAMAPFLLAVAATVALAVVATPRPMLGDVRPALAAVAAWAALSAVGPSLAGDPVTPLGEGRDALTLVAFAAAASAATLLALRYRERRAATTPGSALAPTPAGGRSS